MSTPHDQDPAADEHDPTGVRQLLAGMPDPGPMPEAVAERIRASLAREQEAPQPGGPHGVRDEAPNGIPDLTLGPSMAHPPVSDLTAHRARRRPRHLLAAAAAVTGLAVLGGVVADQLGQDGALETVASIYRDPTTVESGDTNQEGAAVASPSAESQGQDASGQPEGHRDDAAQGGSAPQEPGSAPDGQDDPEPAKPQQSQQSQQSQALQGEDGPDPSDPEALGPTTSQLAVPGTITVLSGRPELSTNTLAVGAASVLEQTTGPEGPTEGSADVPARDTRACVEATGGEVPEAAWWVGPALLDGSAAVLVIGGDAAPGGPSRAWVVSAGCLSTAAADSAPVEVLAGPVALP